MEKKAPKGPKPTKSSLSPEARGIELLPPPTPTGRSKLIAFWARTIGIPLIIGLQLLFLGLFAFRIGLERDLRLLAASVEEKEETLAEAAFSEESFREAQLRLETIERIKKGLCYSCAIKKVEELKPDEITLATILLEGGKLSFSAQTPKGTSFAAFAAEILDEEAIREASITSGILDQEGNFTFTMELVLDEEKIK